MKMSTICIHGACANHLVQFHARSQYKFKPEKLVSYMRDIYHIMSRVRLEQVPDGVYLYTITVLGGTKPEEVCNLISALEVEIGEARRQENLLSMVEG